MLIFSSIHWGGGLIDCYTLLLLQYHIILCWFDFDIKSDEHYYAVIHAKSASIPGIVGHVFLPLWPLIWCYSIPPNPHCGWWFKINSEVSQSQYHSCKVSSSALHVKCSVRLTQWQYVRFIILTQLYKLFPPAGNCHHLLIFYISNIINASQEQGRARWFIDQAVFLFTHSRAQ